MINKCRNIIFISILVLFNFWIIFFTNYKCPWREDFDIYCAGCGGTRMLKSLLIGDFYQAFRYNILLFILMFGGIVYGIYVLIEKELGRCYYKIGERDLIILFFVMFLFMILRNIEIFSFLQPIRVR